MAQKKQFSSLLMILDVGMTSKRVKSNLNKKFLQESCHLTTSSILVVLKAPFIWPVIGILEDLKPRHKLRLLIAALNTLQCITEAYITDHFKVALQCALCTKCMTVNHEHICLVKQFQHYLQSKDDLFLRIRNDMVKDKDQENGIMP